MKKVKFDPNKILDLPWLEFNTCLKTLKEAQLRKLLEYERDIYRRSSYLERIHSRFNNKRYARERREYLKELAA